jgi:hypothetical protein
MALHVVPKTEQDRRAEPHEIKRALQHLIGSFPNSSKEDLSVYAFSLFDDVAAAKPTVETLTQPHGSSFDDRDVPTSVGKWFSTERREDRN